MCTARAALDLHSLYKISTAPLRALQGHDKPEHRRSELLISRSRKSPHPVPPATTTPHATAETTLAHFSCRRCHCILRDAAWHVNPDYRWACTTHLKPDQCETTQGAQPTSIGATALELACTAVDEHRSALEQAHTTKWAPSTRLTARRMQSRCGRLPRRFHWATNCLYGRHETRQRRDVALSSATRVMRGS